MNKNNLIVFCNRIQMRIYYLSWGILDEMDQRCRKDESIIPQDSDCWMSLKYLELIKSWLKDLNLWCPSVYDCEKLYHYFL